MTQQTKPEILAAIDKAEKELEAYKAGDRTALDRLDKLVGEINHLSKNEPA
jgi:hypothetical protein